MISLRLPTVVLGTLFLALPVAGQGLEDEVFSFRDVVYICSFVVSMATQFIYLKIKATQNADEIKRVDKRVDKVHVRMTDNEKDDEAARNKVAELKPKVDLLWKRSGIEGEK